MAAGAMRHRSIRTALLGSLAGTLLCMFLKFLPVIKVLTAFLAYQVIGHFFAPFRLFPVTQYRRVQSLRHCGQSNF
jgi:hypothetical protein